MSHLKISNTVKNNFAELISLITTTPLVSIPAFAVINYYLLNWDDFIAVTSISIFFAALLPTLIVFKWLSGKKIDLDIPDRRERTRPLTFVITSYLIGTAALYAVNAPEITTVLMFCYFSNTLIVLIINLFWKISIHAMGVAVPTTSLIYVFGPIGAIFALIIPVVMWSRVQLRRHTAFQVIIGALLGFVLTILQIHYLING